ncbi:hypothetical protein GIB67_013874 [Kingdonia uniflora]|uniref:Uncharacterized protein n=1 Tax=Kingdonia uniflora TaxID=39325 RepID=A0A7J7LD23_9MAGN|nr:hypothetical protein GIB67_013874 [Kingdonia uniflora]
MASISGCAKANEADLVGHLSLVIGVGDEEDTVAELIEWPRLKGSLVEYPTGSSRFREFCKDKSSIDGIWGHALAYREPGEEEGYKRGAAPRSVSSVSVDDSSKKRKFARPLRDVQLGSQDRSMELDKKISQVEGEKNQLEEKLTRERVEFQLEREKEKEAAALKLKQVRAESESEAERLVTALTISQNNLAGKLYQLRYMKVEITAFSEGNYEEMKIMDEEEVEEREGGLNTVEKTDADNQETINQEIKNSRLRVADLEGLLEVEKKSSVELQLSLKLEEAKRQVEEKTATILSRDLALNLLSSELVELKEKAASSSRLDRLKADLRRLKGKEAQSRVNLVEIQAKNQNLVDDLSHSRGNKSIDLTRQMSERIDQLTVELAELEACRWKDNKRAAITHQDVKELVVHDQEKCDGEVLHQRQLSALVVFFVEEIKFLQVERDLMQDCFSGRTCVCKLDISSIDAIGVMDRGIGTMTAEHIARGSKIVAERAPEYMPSRTKIRGSTSVVPPTHVVGGRLSVVSPTAVVGGRSTALPSRKSSRVKKK